jgi:DNA-binding ferritin-like protein
MAIKSLFPEDMMENKGANSELSLEAVAAKLTYFHEQLHLLHWQTSSYAEHMALGGLYDYVHDVKDEIIEKMMGYTGKRPKAFKIEHLSDSAIANVVVTELISFASKLEGYAEANSMPDIENISQSLSGEAAKVKYLLTLS